MYTCRLHEDYLRIIWGHLKSKNSGENLNHTSLSSSSLQMLGDGSVEEGAAGIAWLICRRGRKSYTPIPISQILIDDGNDLCFVVFALANDCPCAFFIQVPNFDIDADHPVAGMVEDPSVSGGTANA